jgi:glycosyltransferase involved in cell wall biosynthesis
MNILLINKRAPFDGLGAERVIWRIGKRLAARGHEVTFFCPAPSDTYVPDIDNVHFRFVDVPGGTTRKQIEFFLRAPIKYPAVYRDINPDLVYDNPSPFLFHLAHVYGSAPVVTKVHTIYRGKSFIAKDHWLVKLGTLLGDETYRALRGELFTPVSESTATRLNRLLNTERNDVITNPNGTSLSDFQPNEGEPCQVLYLSKLGKKKGIRTLIRAWKQVERCHPDAELIVAGSGPLEQEVERKVEELDLKSVSLLGYVSESHKRELLSSSAIFVLPTYIEGMPLTMIEAMASGCAVVSTETYGVRDVVEDEKTGLLIPPGHKKELADTLLDLLSDPEKTRELGRRGVMRSSHFDVNKMLDRELRIVNNWLQSKQTGLSV